MNETVEALLEERTILDWNLLLKEFLIYDWSVVAMTGLFIGVFFAHRFWYRSLRGVRNTNHKIRQMLAELQEEIDGENGDDDAGAIDADEVEMFPVDPDTDRIVFIMDVSQSMDEEQFALSKNELKEAVEKLAPYKFYQVIFFSGPAWFAGSDFKYNGGDLPEHVSWRMATEENVSATLEEIDEVEPSFGTTWHLPFMLAMQLEPVPTNISFLTDGQTAHQDLLAEGIVQLMERCGGKTKINTTALRAPQAAGPLYRIAKDTGGEFSLIQSGGKVLRGEELEKDLAEREVILDS